MRTKFPVYNYDDMVAAQYKLVTEGLGIRHARLVLGYSMGGMQTWIWGATYPDFMDALVPMASQPTEMSSRNWMMRRLITDTIRNDPEWKDGNYTTQPPPSRWPTCSLASPPTAARWRTKSWPHARAGRQVARTHRLAAPFTADANDVLYSGIHRETIIRRPAWSASRPLCWRSIPRTMSAIRQKPASWSASSSA